MKQNRMAHIHETSPYGDMTPGGVVYGGGNSVAVHTGDWRTTAPVFVADKCTHCLLCFPVCPDSSIPVEGDKRLDFDFDHCKGCGICAAVCPFGAITFGEEG